MTAGERLLRRRELEIARDRFKRADDACWKWADAIGDLALDQAKIGALLKAALWLRDEANTAVQRACLALIDEGERP